MAVMCGHQSTRVAILDFVGELTVPERNIYIINSSKNKKINKVSLLGSKASKEAVFSGVERRRESREERDCLTLLERSKKNSGENK